MAKPANNSSMDAALTAWLARKGINPEEVLRDYIVTHENGKTFITITMFAQEFPLSIPVSRETNRPHPTCIDVTTAAEKPYSSWVCGPDCPPVRSAQPGIRKAAGNEATQR